MSCVGLIPLGSQLTEFEPDIERTYGERKPLAARTLTSTVRPASTRSNSPSASRPRSLSDALIGDEDELSTPGLTDNAETDTETEHDAIDSTRLHKSSPSLDRHQGSLSSGTLRAFETVPAKPTRHDLDNRYFQHDLLVFKNFDIFR